MYDLKTTDQGPRIKLHLKTERTLRAAMRIVKELRRFPEIYPDADITIDGLSKIVSPEPIPEGTVK